MLTILANIFAVFQQRAETIDIALLTFILQLLSNNYGNDWGNKNCGYINCCLKDFKF